MTTSIPAALWVGAFDLSGCFRAYASRRPGSDLSTDARLPMIAPVLPGSRGWGRGVAPSGGGQPGPSAGRGELWHEPTHDRPDVVGRGTDAGITLLGV